MICTELTQLCFRAIYIDDFQRKNNRSEGSLNTIAL